MLTTEMKETKVPINRSLLTRFNQNQHDFHYTLVTCDESWLHYYDPQSKQESMEWKHLGSPKTKKFKASRSTKKIMATIFWDSQGIIHVDCLPRDTTKNGGYYANILHELHHSIKGKRRGKISHGILLHEDCPISYKPSCHSSCAGVWV
ncbi:histone-lysine N-methyltransferase SETMAR-like [Gigantopelta aegis]|uniref:histone-lysine N-methyltransferase SETMAR-like n=1 Tax=Gigantopelta aegis TaxID=1735272 RepID=UPI001B88B5C2|nr:histone-lysine N-methyltransferase SETMAR-like [Gigantopelta aegis]